ncbi:MAG: hypothetical protein KatS3mg015_1479 [Fimbriimonadales bacterium]|nr:MAG: hypothetical protein KatS3mg015_1479 [Fimbriimonadales bacterium]
MLRVARAALSVLSLALVPLVIYAYSSRPDALAAMTAWPLWSWCLLGIAFAALGGRSLGHRVLAVELALWLLTFLLYAPELRTLFRFSTPNDPAWQAAREEGRGLRVVTLNCLVGTKAALAEALSHDPDVVLIQEDPKPREMIELMKRKYGDAGDVVWGNDVAIVFRGKLLEQGTIGDTHSVWARVHLSGGREVMLITFRLRSAVFDANLLFPSVWQRHAANRKRRQLEFEPIAQFLSSLPRNLPVIAGGDFNAPVGEPVFRAIPKGFVDAFEAAGVGWGNTIFNDYPIHRIDRIFVANCRPVYAKAIRTETSDHRMVLADLIVGEPIP